MFDVCGMEIKYNGQTYRPLKRHNIKDVLNILFRSKIESIRIFDDRVAIYYSNNGIKYPHPLLLSKLTR